MQLKEFVAILLASFLILVSAAKKESNFSDQGMARQKEKLPIILRLDKSIPEPEVTAHAYLVKIIGEEEPVLKRRESKPLAPASLTKILTYIVAKETLKERDSIKFSEKSKESAEAGEKLSYVASGEKLSLEDTLKLMLIFSANDAASAIAEKIGIRWGAETYEERIRIFTGLMNKKASELEMNDSYFENPSGLDSDRHLTTARDLAKLAEYVWYKHPEMWEISRTTETGIISNQDKSYTIKNTNDLLLEFPGLLGGKTGFTDNAQGTLLLLYPVKPDNIAIIVILKSDDRFEDGRKIIRWLEKVF